MYSFNNFLNRKHQAQWIIHLLFFFSSFLHSFLPFFLFLFLSFMAVLGLRCCVWAFSSCHERGLLFVAVRGLLIAVASLVAEHGL